MDHRIDFLKHAVNEKMCMTIYVLNKWPNHEWCQSRLCGCISDLYV